MSWKLPFKKRKKVKKEEPEKKKVAFRNKRDDDDPDALEPYTHPTQFHPPLKEAFKKKTAIERRIRVVEEDMKIYCVCKELYDPNKYMLCCDNCNQWFHGECCGFPDEKKSKNIDKFYCPHCNKKDPSLETTMLRKKRTRKQAREEEKKRIKRPTAPVRKRRKIFKVLQTENAKKGVIVKCYCNCKSKKPESKSGLVRCESCSYHFHTECLGLTGLRVESYCCKECYQIRKIEENVINEQTRRKTRSQKSYRGRATKAMKMNNIGLVDEDQIFSMNLRK